jgi:hypothetical protein
MLTIIPNNGTVLAGNVKKCLRGLFNGTALSGNVKKCLKGTV